MVLLTDNKKRVKYLWSLWWLDRSNYMQVSTDRLENQVMRNKKLQNEQCFYRHLLLTCPVSPKVHWSNVYSVRRGHENTATLRAFETSHRAANLLPRSRPSALIFGPSTLRLWPFKPCIPRQSSFLQCFGVWRRKHCKMAQVVCRSPK